MPLAQAPGGALEGLTKYIPIETITLFVAAMATMTALTAMFPAVTKWHVYGLCAAFTPLILWLSALNTFRKSGATGSFPWPWWRMVAATVAFLVWSLSVPPMLEEAQRPIAGLGALLVSTFLTLFDPLFDKPAS
jgi:hypothetical protein